MHLLDTITIISAGLMTGTELAVSAFINPALQRLESGPKAQAVSILARSLGRAMPVWYSLCFALLVLQSFLRRHQTTLAAPLAAAVIWAGTIILSISVLVPINNRIIASLNAGTPPAAWERSPKMGASPPRPHSIADNSPSCRHQCIGCLSSSRL
jgi:uncharacterized membrane protein